jgi:hypothetical protein
MPELIARNSIVVFVQQCENFVLNVLIAFAGDHGLGDLGFPRRYSLGLLVRGDLATSKNRKSGIVPWLRAARFSVKRDAKYRAEERRDVDGSQH